MRTEVATAIAPAEARELLAALGAAPRPAGSLAEGEARRRCARLLSGAGFAVREEWFEYSAFPGRYATALGGALSMVALLVAGHVGSRGHGGWALAVLLVAGAALGTAGRWLVRRGVLDAPWQRTRAVNLVAERGAEGPAPRAAPRVWLVAHLDSKSQPVPILLRAAGITLSAVVWIAALALALLQVLGPAGAARLAAGWLPLALLGVLGGLPVAASLVGDRSAGAADNASGVAAVLLAARNIAATLPAVPLGVLLTSAEELGLAGARAWARGRAPAVAINCDTLDDAGELTCMTSGGEHDAVTTALRHAAESWGWRLAVRRLIPGVLTDGVALADAGWRAATLSRGTLATLARIHRPADRAAALRGDGIVAGARLLAAAVRELT